MQQKKCIFNWYILEPTLSRKSQDICRVALKLIRKRSLRISQQILSHLVDYYNFN